MDGARGSGSCGGGPQEREKIITDRTRNGACLKGWRGSEGAGKAAGNANKAKRSDSIVATIGNAFRRRRKVPQ